MRDLFQCIDTEKRGFIRIDDFMKGLLQVKHTTQTQDRIQMMRVEKLCQSAAIALGVRKTDRWVANEKLEISNFNFKFPRARNIEMIRYYRRTLQGSFSAVSKPNLASKYSLESSRRDLHNALLCTASAFEPRPPSQSAFPGGLAG